jgi:putative ABC transport system permease protein
VSGGAIGIFLAWIIAKVVEIIASGSGMALHPVMGLDAILLATIFSLVIGCSLVCTRPTGRLCWRR